MLQVTCKSTMVIPSLLLLPLVRLHAVLQTHYADVLLPKTSGDALLSVRDILPPDILKACFLSVVSLSDIFSKFDLAGDGFLGPVIEACE